MAKRRAITSAGRLFLGGATRLAGAPDEAQANIASAAADLSFTVGSLAFAAAGRRILAANEEIETTEAEQAEQAFASSAQALNLQATSLDLDADQMLRNLGRMTDEELLDLGKFGVLEEFDRGLDERFQESLVDGLEPEHLADLEAHNDVLRLKTLDAARLGIENRFLGLQIADQMLSIDAVIGSMQRFQGPAEIATMLDIVGDLALRIRDQLEAVPKLFPNAEGREALIKQKSGQLHKVAFDHALATEPLVFARWVMAGGLQKSQVLKTLDAQESTRGFLSFQDIYTAKAKKVVRTQWEVSFGDARLEAIAAEKPAPSFEDNLVHRQDAYSERMDELQREGDLFLWAGGRGLNQDTLDAVHGFLEIQITSADAQLAMFEAGGDIVLNGAGGGASPGGRQAVALFLEEEYMRGIRARFGQALVALASKDEAVQLSAQPILDEIAEDIIDVILKSKHVPDAIGQFQESIRQIGTGGRLMSASILRHITKDGEGILAKGSSPTSGARADAIGGLGPAAIADGALINSLQEVGLAPPQAAAVATEMQRKMAGNRNEALAALKALKGEDREASPYAKLIKAGVDRLEAESGRGVFVLNKELPTEAVTAYKRVFDSQYLLTGSTKAASDGSPLLFKRAWEVSKATGGWRHLPPEIEYRGLEDRVYADFEERWKLTAKAQNAEDLSEGKPPSMSEIVPWDEIILDPIPTSEPGKMGYVVYQNSVAFGFKSVALVTKVGEKFERPVEFLPNTAFLETGRNILGLRGFSGLTSSEIKFWVRGIREGRKTADVLNELSGLRKLNDQPLIRLGARVKEQLRRVAETDAQGEEIIEALRVPRE